MPSRKRPPAPINPPPAKQRKCRGCGQFGHDRRNCPSAAQKVAVAVDESHPEGNGNRKPVERSDSRPSPALPPLVEASEIDWETVLYVVFDLETTGRRLQQDEIIELAGVILDPNGIEIEDASFSEFVKPLRPIPSYITQLTSITNDMVSLARPFADVANDFISFIKDTADEYGGISNIFLVGHNARNFDIPWLVHQLNVHGIMGGMSSDTRINYGMDTIIIAKQAVRNDSQCGAPTAYNLPMLYQFVSGRIHDNAHRAMADVKATATIFRFFFQTRQDTFFQIGERGAPYRQPVLVTTTTYANDSEDEDSESGSSASQEQDGPSDDDEDTNEPGQVDVPVAAAEETVVVPLGDRWQENCDYSPTEPIPMERFTEQQQVTARSGRNKTGLQCLDMEVHTPIRAWRTIFQKNFLLKIVKYTNDYGQLHAKKWRDMTRQDLENFFAVLFISGIQKRKDKPTNWWSENKILESSLIKKVMSGRRFFDMLRYLHCCPVENRDSSAVDYDPMYKVNEVKDYLESRYDKVFSPGQQLSLDETLIRAFGRIKFKVRIITKAARYGIKIYVVTDAVTAFVLRVLVYTGKSTYYDDAESNAEKLKTVQIVKRLVEPFAGSHRTIYIDRFYTSIDLLKSLAEINLYVTGTVLANRIPLGIRIPKTSKTFKQMKRGDSVKCKVSFRKQNGEEGEAGLVCWRDRNIVYCLSNDTDNNTFDNCTRRGLGGLINIPRPLSIANYNKYMGGVDLADMRRLHCNSTIMGQKRWWLKIFFYLLDVGTSNALVLHNEYLKKKAGDGKHTPMNIVHFKMKLVESLIGRTIDSLFEVGGGEEEQHQPVRIADGVRSQCAWCSLMSRKKRTRYQCAKCGIPLCSIGTGRVAEDCFTIAHETEEKIDMIHRRFDNMKKYDRNPKRK